jgi:hypothetical protein
MPPRAGIFATSTPAWAEPWKQLGTPYLASALLTCTLACTGLSLLGEWFSTSYHNSSSFASYLMFFMYVCLNVFMWVFIYILCIFCCLRISRPFFFVFMSVCPSVLSTFLYILITHFFVFMCLLFAIISRKGVENMCPRTIHAHWSR